MVVFDAQMPRQLSATQLTLATLIALDWSIGLDSFLKFAKILRMNDADFKKII
jgi:hypothetical protein